MCFFIWTFIHLYERFFPLKNVLKLIRIESYSHVIFFSLMSLKYVKFMVSFFKYYKQLLLYL